MAIFTHEDERIVASVTLTSLQGSIALEFSHGTQADRTIIVNSDKVLNGITDIGLPAEGLTSNGWTYDGFRVLGDTLAIGSTTSTTAPAIITEFGAFHTAGHVSIDIDATYGKFEIENTVKQGSLYQSHQFPIADISPLPGAVAFGQTTTITTVSVVHGPGDVVTSGTIRSGHGTGLITDAEIVFLHEVNVPAIGLTNYQVTLPEAVASTNTPGIVVLAGVGITTGAVTFPTAGNRTVIQFDLNNAGAVAIDADLEIVFAAAVAQSHKVVLDDFQGDLTYTLATGETLTLLGSSIAITS